MGASFANRSLLAVLRLLRVKTWASPATLNAVIRLSRRSGAARPSRRLRALCDIRSSEIEGDLVYRLAPRGRNPPFHIFYLHGGAYSIEIGFLHWQFIEDMIRRTGCAVTVPLYPLAPEHGSGEALASALRHYRDLVGRTPPGRIVVMGDSAGGGLSLVLAQALQAEGLRQPGHIVLLSPWLDLTMSHPATLTHEQDDHDPVLKIEAALAAARMYAGDLPLDDPRLSPIYGALKGLAPITVLTGTHDILNPDARRFAERMGAEGQPVQLIEYPGMVHAWMLLPLPESHQAREEIADILLRHFQA